MNPVSNTAFYCCGVRMDDAERELPVCNDIYAKQFMDERAMAIYEPFRSEIMPNISNLARCRIIDDFLREEIRENDDTEIITIGAGFDSRPYRLAGGHWTELDEPQIINYKNEKLPPTECKNKINRISIDFSTESLADKLEGINKSHHIVIVIEGVFLYLEPEAITHTLKALQRVFPKHVLLCEMMSKNFFDKYAHSIHSKLVDTGGVFSTKSNRPEEVFIDNHYELVTSISTFRWANDHGVIQDIAKKSRFVVNLLLRTFMRDLNGYAVYYFRYRE